MPSESPTVWKFELEKTLQACTNDYRGTLWFLDDNVLFLAAVMIAAAAISWFLLLLLVGFCFTCDQS